MNENKQVTLESNIPSSRSRTQHFWRFSGFRTVQLKNPCSGTFSPWMLVAPRVETSCWSHAQRLWLMAVEHEATARPRNLGQQTHRDRTQHQWRTKSSESIRASQEGNIVLKFRPRDCLACLSFRCVLSFPAVKWPNSNSKLGHDGCLPRHFQSIFH